MDNFKQPGEITFDDVFNSSSKAFTLAEVLITLGIIGVVAAITIPSVIVRTNQQEFRTGAKKALSALNQAVGLVEAQDGLMLEHALDSNASAIAFSNALEKRLNIIKTDNEDGYNVFYTADGFKYYYDPHQPNVFYIDVNGDRGPTSSDSYDWAEADYDSWDDFTNPEWPNVKLTDMFFVEFSYGGGSYIEPYVGQGKVTGPPTPTGYPY